MKRKKKDYKALLAAEPNLAAFLTLFSFGTVARAVQFFVPVIIYSLFPPSKELDFYFYWTTQSTLIATFLSAIWPSALVSLIIKARTQGGQDCADRLSSVLLRRFMIFTFVVAFISALLATQTLLGGPLIPETRNLNLLWGIIITISCSTVALAISEIATAQRKFGLAYQGILASAVVQVLVLALFQSELLLELSFLFGCCTQLAVCIWKAPRKLWISTSAKTEHRENSEAALAALLPSKKTIALLYFGGIFTLLTSHLSYRLLGDDQVGIVAAFSIASMLALAPQQLFIQHLSTVAGIAMTESFHSSSAGFARVSRKWRDRLFRLSLFLGLSLACCSLAAVVFLPRLAVAKESWILVASMVGLLSLPLAISGLNTWFARLTISIEKIYAGVWHQIFINTVTITLLFICARYSAPFSSALALSISAFVQFFSISIYQRVIYPENRYFSGPAEK